MHAKVASAKLREASRGQLQGSAEQNRRANPTRTRQRYWAAVGASGRVINWCLHNTENAQY